jgi:aspartyl-tRNA(Asn)/glutamyl-tRNA(Gln) amidotransferase subunit C
MKITVEEVEHIAVLARLRLSPEEKSRLTKELDDILEYMDKLNRLDTSQIQPFTHALRAESALRDDAVTSRPNPEALLANAPDRDGTFFKVPKILE